MMFHVRLLLVKFGLGRFYPVNVSTGAIGLDVLALLRRKLTLIAFNFLGDDRKLIISIVPSFDL